MCYVCIEFHNCSRLPPPPEWIWDSQKSKRWNQDMQRESGMNELSHTHMHACMHTHTHTHTQMSDVWLHWRPSSPKTYPAPPLNQRRAWQVACSPDWRPSSELNKQPGIYRGSSPETCESDTLYCAKHMDPGVGVVTLYCLL